MVQTNETSISPCDSKFDAKRFCVNLPLQPGVYRMMNAKGEVIYVGKAVSLKKRVSSYFQKIKL
mgnify:FL=1